MAEESWPKEWIDPVTGERLTTMATHRSGPYAKPIEYYAYDENATLACWKCEWSGPAKDGARGYFKELFDVSCPRCETMLLIVSFPTADATKAAAASGNARAEADLPALLQAEAWRRRADELTLKSADQLPELAGKRLEFTWDIEQGNDEHWTVIGLGDTIVWREWAYYEGWPRFNEVKEILKERYGERFQSLTPSSQSELYLYGDDGSAKVSTT
jgi:hypothetical protein